MFMLLTCHISTVILSLQLLMFFSCKATSAARCSKSFSLAVLQIPQVPPVLLSSMLSAIQWWWWAHHAATYCQPGYLIYPCDFSYYHLRSSVFNIFLYLLLNIDAYLLYLTIWDNFHTLGESEEFLALLPQIHCSFFPGRLSPWQWGSIARVEGNCFLMNLNFVVKKLMV